MEWGLYVTRKREARRLRPPPAWLWLPVAAALLLLVAGAARVWPQSSGSSSSNSSSDLRKWEALSDGFREALTGQSQQLRQALTELETSKVNLMQLTSLLEQSLTANEHLRNYNGQIAERMQAGDEALAWAYGEIHRLEKRALRLVVAVAILGAAIVVIAAIHFVVRR